MVSRGDLRARFSIAIAPGMHPMFYEYEDLVRSVDALGAAAFTLRLDGADVARYRVERSTSPRVEIVLTAEASARLERDATFAKWHAGYFDVRLDGVRRYVAIGWPRIRAAAIPTPVVPGERP